MRVLSLVVAGLLALFVASSTGWANPSSSGGNKTPAASDKAKSGAAKKPAKKGEVNLGSSARQELLKQRQQAQSKDVKKKPSALSKKPVRKKS